MTQVKPEKIKVLQDRILIKILTKEDNKTPGGLIIPNTPNVNKKTELALVVRLGKDVNSEPLKSFGETESADDTYTPDIKVGDTIIFDKYAGNPLIIDDQTYIIIKVDDVLAVVEE
ncbi:MAG: co-chaperone GroES [Bryobacteraceae bacterium]